MGLADALDAIPIVQNSAERAVRFPAPQIGQRVQNLASGAIERWSGAWVSDFLGAAAQMVNVKAAPYNAVGDGVADDTAAMAAAHATGAVVYYPAGTYKFSTITMADGGIIGDGKGKTKLVSTNTTGANLITFTGGAAGIPSTATAIPRFSGFSLWGDAAKLTGAGLYISPPAGETHYGHFENFRVMLVPTGIQFVAASRFKMIGVDVVNFLIAGVVVENTVFQDDGDSVIMGCVIENMGAPAGIGIHYKSSAGLKVLGNKLNVCAHGMKIEWTGNGSGILTFAGNSVENCITAGISFGRVSGFAFANFIVTGNEFSLCQTCILGTIGLTKVVIGDNVLACHTSGINKGIDITDGGNLSIAGNVISGNGGTSTGIALTNCDNAEVGINTFVNLTTKVSYTTCTNLVDHNVYRGTVVLPNVTTTTAFTLPLGTIGLYEVFALLPSASGGAAAISGTARIVADGAALRVMGSDVTAPFLISVSGANVQLWHNTGVSQTLNWGYRRIA